MWKSFKMDAAFFNGLVPFMVTLLQFCTETVSSDPNITVSANDAIRGSTAEMVCSFKELGQEIVVKWEREVEGQDRVIAAYNFLERTSQYSFGDDRYTLTYRPTAKLSYATLEISSVSLDDIGNYKCELFGHITDSESLRLEVLVPPDDIRIKDTRTNTELPNGSTLRVTEGVPTVITCLTDFIGTRPATELIWKAQGNAITTESVTNVKETLLEPRLEQTVSRMNFTTSFKAHGKWLECQGNHDGLPEALRARVTLDVDVPPSMIQLKKSIIADYYDGEKVTLIQGTQFTVSCTIPGTKPEVDIDWYLDSEPLDPSSTRNSVNIVKNPGNNLLKDTTGVLTIQNPGREYHGKQLKCIGTGAGGNTIEGSLQLEVNGPPDEPQIFQLPSNIREGEEVRFSCSAHNGFPASNLRWMIDGRLDISSNATQGNFSSSLGRSTTSSMLSFFPTPEYNNRELSCVVAEYEHLRTSVTLNIKYCPRMFSFASCPAVRNRDIASLTCEVGPSNPALGLTLSLNGEELIVNPREEQFTGLGYPGMITRLDYASPPVYRENGPFTYRCCMVDGTSDCPVVPCQECTLDIHYEPIISRISMSPESGIKIGKKVSISCQAEGNPMTDDLIRWEVQEPGSTEWIPFNTSTADVEIDEQEWWLVFKEVRISDAKGYRCVADNGVGSVVYSPPVKLSVTYTPIILDSVPTLVRTQEGGEKALFCHAWGNPTPTITWYNGTRLRMETDPGKHIISESIESENSYNGSLVNGELNFFKVSREKHFGVYYCNATNQHGTTLLRIVLNGTSVPESPSSLREIVRLTTSTSLSFAWTPGEDGGEVQSFEISFCPNRRSSECIDVTRTIANYTASGLLPYTKYRIAIYSRNAVGYSSRSLDEEAITLPLPPNKEGIDITYNPASGEVVIAKDPSGSFNMEELPCIKLDVRGTSTSMWEEQLLPCLRKDLIVTIPKDLPLSSIRVKSCIPDTDRCSAVGPLALTSQRDEPPTTLIITIAIIVACIVLVIIVILALVCRRKPSGSNIHSDGHLEMKKRTDGYKSFSKDFDNSTGRGEKEAFLPPVYTEQTSVYESVTMVQPKSPNSYDVHQQPNGHGLPVDSNSQTTNNTNGLIYAEIGHIGSHPSDQPPIRTEMPTEYAHLDYRRMEEIKENQKNEENTRNELAMKHVQPTSPTIYPENNGLECV